MASHELPESTSFLRRLASEGLELQRAQQQFNALCFGIASKKSDILNNPETELNVQDIDSAQICLNLASEVLHIEDIKNLSEIIGYCAVKKPEMLSPNWDKIALSTLSALNEEQDPDGLDLGDRNKNLSEIFSILFYTKHSNIVHPEHVDGIANFLTRRHRAIDENRRVVILEALNLFECFIVMDSEKTIAEKHAIAIAKPYSGCAVETVAQGARDLLCTFRPDLAPLFKPKEAHYCR